MGKTTKIDMELASDSGNLEFVGAKGRTGMFLGFDPEPVRYLVVADALRDDRSIIQLDSTSRYPAFSYFEGSLESVPAVWLGHAFPVVRPDTRIEHEANIGWIEVTDGACRLVCHDTEDMGRHAINISSQLPGSNFKGEDCRHYYGWDIVVISPNRAPKILYSWS